MGKEFAFGLALGMMGGALIVANSYKARKIVKDGQNQLKEKASSLCKKNKNSDEYEDSDDE